MNEKISAFIEAQTSGTLACVDEAGRPWCFNFFYSWNPEKGLMHFKSSDDTRHAVLLHANRRVAGTVLPDKFNKLQIKGIQFEGEIILDADPLAAGGHTHYYLKHPMALAMPGEIWTIRLDHIKFTDNSLGFGKKLSWKR